MSGEILLPRYFRFVMSWQKPTTIDMQELSASPQHSCDRTRRYDQKPKQPVSNKTTNESSGSRGTSASSGCHSCVLVESGFRVFTTSKLNISHILVCSVRFSELLYKNLTILNYEGNLCHLTYLSFLLGIQKSKTETNGQEVH